MSGERALRKRGLCAWLIVAGGGAAAWWWHQPAQPAEMSADRVAADKALGRDTAPGAIIVDLRDDVGNEDVVRLGGQHFVDLVPLSSQSRKERLFRIEVQPSSRDALVLALEADPAVDSAEPESILSVDATPGVTVEDGVALGFPDDPMFEYQWHLRQIDMPRAWYLGDGDGVVVAVLDTGVAFESTGGFARAEDLGGVELVKPYDFVDDDERPNDSHGHGTHVTGTIAQTTDNGLGAAGVAPRVAIMPLRVASDSGVASAGAVADAIYYAVDEGADVINLSLSGGYPSTVVYRALDYAHDRGVVVVCAAGNGGHRRVAYPAAYPTTIAVGASGTDGERAPYSNYGPRLDLLAPGGDLSRDGNGDGVVDGVVQNTISGAHPGRNVYLALEGTGLSAAHASGVAAMLIGEGVSSPASVERLMVASASGDGETGRLDAGAALLKVRFEIGAWQLGLGLLVALSLALSVRRKVGFVGFPLGVLLGASGLFFLPYFAPEVSSLVGVEELTRGLPSVGAGNLGALYANPALLSAVPALLLVVLLLRVPGMRTPLAGICAGVAGHLLFLAVSGMVDVVWMPADLVWLVGNAALAAGLGALVLARES